MHGLHQRLLTEIATERDRVLSRRGFLVGGGRLAAGGALAAVALPGFGRLSALAQTAPAGATAAPFTNDVDVLNYALTLEHLEYAFYRDGVGQFQFGNGPFNDNIGTYLMAIRDHEKAHVDGLTQAITGLGGAPVAEAKYDFGYGSDQKKFLATAQALENLGVQAYDGAGQYLKSAQLLTVAGEIVAVEARHASYLNLLNGTIPFPSAFETPATKAEVLKIAGPFIVSGT